jgi:Fe-S-cluster-containing hydrogenase component 2
MTTEELWATFPGPIMTVATLLVVGFLIVWWLGAKGFCTHGCPYGAFFAVADRLAPVRIKVTDACDACGHCTSVCTSNVRVHEEVARHKQIVDPGCMKCLDCVSVCPKEALYVGIAMPKPFAISQQRIQARADFTWPEEILLAVVAVFTTQWVWRGAWFGEGVPFLLAVGLGVITAVFTLLSWRLLRRREVLFQHTPLKVGGVLSRAGRWAMVGLVAWLGLALHTWIVKQKADAAFAAAQAPLQASFYRPRPTDGEPANSPARLLAALGSAESALSWSLIAEPKLLEVRALLLGAQRLHADAERRLAEVWQRFGRFILPESSLAFASYCLDGQPPRLELAGELIADVLRSSPRNPIALALQARWSERSK